MRKRSIVFNLTIMGVATIILSSCAGFIITHKIENQLLLDEKANQMKAIAQVIAIISKNAVATRDTDSLRTIVMDVIQDEQQVSNIIVFKNTGEPLFDNTFDKKIQKSIYTRIEKWKNGRDTLAMFSDFEANHGKYTLIVSKITENVPGEHASVHVIGFVGLIYQQMSVLEIERTRQIIIIGNSVARTVRSMVENYNIFEARALLQEIKANNPDVRFAYILSPDNSVMIDSNEKEEGTQIKDKVARNAQLVNSNNPVIIQQYKNNKKEEIIDISFLIDSDGEKLGVLRIGLSIERLRKHVADLQMMLGGIVIFFVAVSLVLCIVAARRFAKPVLYLADSARRIGQGDLDLQVSVNTGGSEMQVLAASFNAMVKGLKERNQIKDTFSRYVSRQVVDELMKSPDNISLGGAYRDVTILFADIRGFTHLSELLPADLVVEILNEYFNVMVDVVFEFEGTLDKYIGDALMAVFGSPVAHTDDPLRAVQTALKMREELIALNKKWTEKDGLPPICIGIGINTGNVISGNIGHLQRMEYTVIGDNVNIASRIEGLTKQYDCSIIISESTYELVKDHVCVHPLESVKVKGKNMPIIVYELLSLEGNSPSSGCSQ